MEIQGRRRSDNFEDRGQGQGPRLGGAGIPVQLLLMLVQRLGFKGSLIVAALAGGAYLLMPDVFKQALLGGGTQQESPRAPGRGACELSSQTSHACDFSRVVLASTEDVWTGKFAAGALPDYGVAAPSYQAPTLVVFSQAVSTGGCGEATSAVGPFYCPADRKLYIDPEFYETMAKRLKAPGDFAQAYVIAHEVGHHVQSLIGAARLRSAATSKNQASVRFELQADCLAGVWGHTARASLAISDEDLGEALHAAHAIGDDALGHQDQATFTHGSSEQRKHWFRTGFESGDARNCDTFAVATP
ncbi:MAG TPA: neutral zinc metallopeptidase [Polyangiaceae bacterium]|nr:neutral zinc metallopeptidase [Polyangiaceae bacterium]